MIGGFPREIINLILDEVPNRNDLKNLCEVSRSYYHATIPRLYETVVIKRPSPTKSLAIEPLTCHRSTQCFQFVKNLKFTLGYEHVYQLDRNRKNGDVCTNAFEDFSISILALLDQFKDQQLESFGWDLRICAPAELFGADGYLTRKQSRIQSLSLVTDPLCHHSMSENSLNLIAFRNLRYFSWKNIQPDGHALHALGSWLQSNLELVRMLELGFGTGNIYGFQGWSDFLSSKALELRPNLPSLESLTLSKVRFKRKSIEMTRFFNFNNLRTLKIHDCADTNNLLQTAVESNISLKLTTFGTVASCSNGVSIESIPAVIPFLESFRGLRYLYLDLNYPIEEYSTYLHAVAQHSRTLKRVVFEQSLLDLNSQCQTFCCTEWGFMGALYDSVEPLLNTILQGGKLECLGFHDSFILLKPFLNPSMGKSLKVLHLRKRGIHLTTNAVGLLNRREQLHQEMIHNNQLFNCESETGDEADSYQPDQLHRTRHGFKRSPESIRHTTIRRWKNRDRCVSKNWEIYQRRLLMFAQWAFGPDGFPNLQFIVYGDFTEDRYAEKNIVLCRNTTTQQQQPLHEQSDASHSHSCRRPNCEKETTTDGQQKYKPRFRLVENSGREVVDLKHDYCEFLSSIPSGCLSGADAYNEMEYLEL